MMVFAAMALDIVGRDSMFSNVVARLEDGEVELRVTTAISWDCFC